MKPNKYIEYVYHLREIGPLIRIDDKCTVNMSSHKLPVYGTRVDASNSGYQFEVVFVQDHFLVESVHGAYVSLRHLAANDLLSIRYFLSKYAKKLRWTDFDIDTVMYLYVSCHPDPCVNSLINESSNTD